MAELKQRLNESDEQAESNSEDIYMPLDVEGLEGLYKIVDS